MKISTKKIKLKKPKYRRRSAKEIVEIAKGIWDQKIFTSNHLHDHERQNLGMVFLPLSMMDAVQSRNMWRQDPWMFYGKRGEKHEFPGANGLPMLDNVAWLDKKDTLRVEAIIRKYEDAIKRIDAEAV